MENNKYGKLDSELLMEEMLFCRKIIQEIGNSGVNERQRINLIKLLCLELEDNNLSKKIYELITNHKDNLSLLHD
jgi:hypothetical protein